MKNNARWVLPVYPVLKDQSHWKMCEHIFKKTQRPNTIQLHWIVKKPVESQYSSSSVKKTHTFTIIAMNFVQEQLTTPICCPKAFDFSKYTRYHIQYFNFLSLKIDVALTSIGQEQAKWRKKWHSVSFKSKLFKFALQILVD